MSRQHNGAVEVVRKRDLESYFDELRRVVCRVDALADATVDAIIGAYGEQHRSLVDERVHQLASATAEAALDAVEELDRAGTREARPARGGKADPGRGECQSTGCTL